MIDVPKTLHVFVYTHYGADCVQNSPGVKHPSWGAGHSEGCMHVSSLGLGPGLGRNVDGPRLISTFFFFFFFFSFPRALLIIDFDQRGLG